MITTARYGRVVTAAAGAIDVFPVNHVVDGRSVLFRTAAGTKLLELTINSSVVFQVDGLDDTEVYSVVLKGTAEEVSHSREIERLDALGLIAWAPEEKDRWVRIGCEQLTGVAFEPAPAAGRDG